MTNLKGGIGVKIIADTIFFKSAPDNYYKEESGDKCNTVRRIFFWSEMREFEKFYKTFQKRDKQLFINITNPDDKTFFVRTITDITPFEGLWIISWRHE